MVERYVIADEKTAGESGQAKHGESNTVIIRAFLANLGIAVAKFVGAMITGSAAMWSEGVQSLVDTTNQLLLYYGKKQAQRPADRLHPLGYAREQYFWSFIVGLLIFGLGGGIALYQGITHLQHPEPSESPALALAILAVAFALESWSLSAALKTFNAARGRLSFWQGIKTSRDTETISVLLEDIAAVTGLVLAAGGIGLEMVTGDAKWDAIASILIGIVLVMVAFILLVKAKHLLIGQTADPATVRQVWRIAAAQEGVERVREVIAIQLSVDKIMGIVDIDFDDHLSVEEAAALFREIRRKVHGEIPDVVRLYIAAGDSHVAALTHHTEANHENI